MMQHLKILKENAYAPQSSQDDWGIYISAAFCFENGNANRPGIIDQATIAEYVCWKEAYERQISDDNDKLSLPIFKVSF